MISVSRSNPHTSSTVVRRVIRSLLLAIAAHAVTLGICSAAQGSVESGSSGSSVDADALAAHDLLAARVGDFQLTSTFWPAPDAQAVVTRQRARRSLILGNRVLQLEVIPIGAHFAGADETSRLAEGFFGTGLEGYDESTDTWWYVWTDTSTTGVAVLHGSGPVAGGSYLGTTPTPAGPQPLRVEIAEDGADEVHTYWLGEGDSTHRMLELRYEPTR